MIALLLALVVAVVLIFHFQRKGARLERAMEKLKASTLKTEGELQSENEVRSLAESVNVMTESFREQISKEMEAKQFESFIRLSAVLTHDLKNAIEAQSLVVSNMEAHFNNEQFRADAMKSLALTNEKLKGLVGRISNPVTSLSNENKQPTIGDLVPVLRKIIKARVDPLQTQHRVKIELPDSLPARFDSERMERVIENLIINALESMSTREGTLTISAGQINGGKVFFSITDTGVGMSQEFMTKRLFRPFSTTKRTGVGLGLYTSREVVRFHGGWIDVESVEGAGTQFKITLPSP